MDRLAEPGLELDLGEGDRRPASGVLLLLRLGEREDIGLLAVPFSSPGLAETSLRATMTGATGSSNCSVSTVITSSS